MKKITILPLLALSLYSCNEDEIRENQNVQMVQNQSVDFSVKALYSTNHKVSAKEAESQLMNLLNASNNGLKSTSGKTIKQTTAILRSSGLKSTNGDTLAYAFNFSDNGYAICSADDRTPESVLAIIDNGSYEEASENEHYEFISNSIENYIDYSIENFEANKGTYLSIVNSLGDINQLKSSLNIPKIIGYQANLLNTQWGQSSPYNKELGLCNSYNKNGCNKRVVTGCASIAFSQVFYYWQLPDLYDWERVDLESFNIGEFVANTSKAINTTYSCDSHGGSASDDSKIMDYLDELDIKYDYLYKSSDLTFDKVKSLLDKKLPLIITAIARVGNADYGHAWVIDGYLYYQLSNGNITSTKKLVHCNWGWGGYCNGYFSYNVFNAAKGVSYDNNNHDEGMKDYTFSFISSIYAINSDGSNKIRLYVGKNSESDETIDTYDKFEKGDVRGLLGCAYINQVSGTYPFCKYKKNGKYIYCIEKGTNSKGYKILENCSSFTSEGCEFVKCLGYVYDNVGDGLTPIVEYRNRGDNSYHGVSYHGDKYILNKYTYEVTYFAALCRVY